MPNRRQFLTASLPIVLGACSVREITQTLGQAISTGSLQGTAESFVRQKVQSWATNPNQLAADLKRGDGVLRDFLRDVIGVWGKDNVVQPTETVHVKYQDRYRTRSIIDFEAGQGRVETLDKAYCSCRDALVAARP